MLTEFLSGAAHGAVGSCAPAQAVPAFLSPSPGRLTAPS